jgi:hypothetical protein
MPLDEWYTTRWGPPVAPWTKYQKPRDLAWLVVVLGVTTGALFYAWFSDGRVSHDEAQSPEPSPLTAGFLADVDFFALALAEARRNDESVRPCSMALTRELDGGSLAYKARIGLLSLDDPNWHAEVDVQQTRGLFGPRLRIERTRFAGDEWRWPDCRGPLQDPAIDSLRALQAMWEVGEPAMFEYFERWPHLLSLTQTPDGSLIWEGEFGSRSATDYLRIAVRVDAETGKVIVVEAHPLSPASP